MRGIVDWLENLGLSQYIQRFVDNDIDLILLSELTDGDLKELGVVSLGHRSSTPKNGATWLKAFERRRRPQLPKWAAMSRRNWATG
jgi:SAM domain (Sterile alpha motif)